MRADLRRLSHTLKKERDGRTSDDATLFMIEWHGGAPDHRAVLD
ncbi:serine/threonine-protein phosphatase, partial [Streptomyces sp. NPDC005056]